MDIRGLYKSSLLDFPGKISAVIFTNGCNLRCGYCHNPHFVTEPGGLDRIDENEIIEFLHKRKKLLDSLTISGGEPLLQKGLIPFIEKVKETGLLIKLDTNGFSPEVLRGVIETGNIDYIALDIKTSPEKYNELTGVKLDSTRVFESLELIRKNSIDFELRTTCVPGFVTVEDIIKIGSIIGHVDKYFLQQFVNDNDLISKDIQNLEPYKNDYLHLMLEEVSKFSDNSAIRGI